MSGKLLFLHSIYISLHSTAIIIIISIVIDFMMLALIINLSLSHNKNILLLFAKVVPECRLGMGDRLWYWLYRILVSHRCVCVRYHVRHITVSYTAVVLARQLTVRFHLGFSLLFWEYTLFIFYYSYYNYIDYDVCLRIRMNYYILQQLLNGSPYLTIFYTLIKILLSYTEKIP